MLTQQVYIPMLAPPENGASRDKGVLDEAGRQRYLNSLERRLGKLEGGNRSRKQLTSRDILQSLSEARDDHLQQFVGGAETEMERGRNRPWGHSGGGGGRSDGRNGRESPFSIRNEFADVDLGGGGGGENVVQRGGRGGGGRGSGGSGERRVAGEGGGEDRPATGGSVWTCCLCCKGERGRQGYRRATLRRGVAGEEDQSRLVDCDELSLEWQNEDINDIT